MVSQDSAAAVSTIGRIASVVADHGSADERAQAVLDELHTLIPFEAAEISCVNPLTGQIEEVAATGYSDEVLDGLRSQRFLDLMDLLGLQESGRPIRMKDLPGDPLDNWAVSDLLIPAGYAEGMTMALRTPDGRFTGVLNLSTTSTSHPSDIARDAVAQLCSALGTLTDPMRAGRWLAMLLGSDSTAVGLGTEGHVIPLPGIQAHPLLAEGSELMDLAVGTGTPGTWHSFIWDEPESWYRVRVVPCASDPHLQAIVSMDSVDVGPLSRRELEVLTLAAEGLSNGEIGDALVISGRTVGSHIEHVLDKLCAPNRAAAVAHAIREGLLLGRVARFDGPAR